MITIGCPQLGHGGRLGNQLFQVASTIGIAMANGDEPVFPADWAYRPYFSVPDEWFIDMPQGVQTYDARVEEFVPYLGHNASYLQDVGLFAACKRGGFGVEEIVRRVLKPSGLAVAHLADPMLDLLELPHPVLSVHVRRGDNVPANDPGTPDKHLYHPLRPATYYTGAIIQAYMRYTVPRSLAVFSDDLEWCRHHLPPADFYGTAMVRPAEQSPEYQTEMPMDWVDLFLMAMCDFHIISNSTFAWWGAWLSDDPSPTYPWPWFGPKVDADASLMFPESWVRVEHGQADPE